MDTVTLLKKERSDLLEILKQNSVKTPLVTGNCPQCQQTDSNLTYYTQTDPECPHKEEVPQQQDEIPQEVVDFQTDGIQTTVYDETVETQAEENIQQTTNAPLFL